MPFAAAKSCLTPGCPGVTHGGRCAACLANRYRQQDDRRPSSYERGYDAKWRILRAMFLKAHPRCRACGQPASHVDHLVSKAKGGSNSWSNLQPLCASCHSRKTVQQDGGFAGRLFP